MLRARAVTGAQLLYGGVLACLVPHYVAPSTALLQAATLFSAALLGASRVMH